MKIDFIGSFETFLREQNPNVCLICWGEGRLIEILPITGFKHDIECPNCKGTGEIKIVLAEEIVNRK